MANKSADGMIQPAPIVIDGRAKIESCVAKKKNEWIQDMKQRDTMREQRKEMVAILENILAHVGLENAKKDIHHTVFPVCVFVNCSDDDSSAFELEVDYDYYKEQNMSLTLIGITPHEAEEFLKMFLAKRKVE